MSGSRFVLIRNGFPRSIAVLGATEREGTVGRNTVENLLKGKFAGPLFAVNPRYESICGVPCGRCDPGEQGKDRPKLER